MSNPTRTALHRIAGSPLLALLFVAALCCQRPAAQRPIYGLSPGEISRDHLQDPDGNPVTCAHCHASVHEIKQDYCRGLCHVGDVLQLPVSGKTPFLIGSHAQPCIKDEIDRGGCQRCHKEHRGSQITLRSCTSAESCPCTSSLPVLEK